MCNQCVPFTDVTHDYVQHDHWRRVRVPDRPVMEPQAVDLDIPALSGLEPENGG
jgi:hypothetical protein